MRRQKIGAYLALVLCVMQVLVVLVSWLLTAAMPDVFVHSLTSAEGIRWFMGGFTDMLATPYLVWLVLVSIAVGCVRESGLLHSDRSEYRQRTAFRLVLLEMLVAVLIILGLTVVPHAILLNVLGGLWSSSFSRCLVPYCSLAVIVMSVSYGLMSERLRGIPAIYSSLNAGVCQMSPLFLFYVLVMQLYRSIMYLACW